MTISPVVDGVRSGSSGDVPVLHAHLGGARGCALLVDALRPPAAPRFQDVDSALVSEDWKV